MSPPALPRCATLLAAVCISGTARLVGARRSVAGESAAANAEEEFQPLKAGAAAALGAVIGRHGSVPPPASRQPALERETAPGSRLHMTAQEPRLEDFETDESEIPFWADLVQPDGSLIKPDGSIVMPAGRPRTRVPHAVRSREILSLMEKPGHWAVRLEVPWADAPIDWYFSFQPEEKGTVRCEVRAQEGDAEEEREFLTLSPFFVLGGSFIGYGGATAPKKSGPEGLVSDFFFQIAKRFNSKATSPDDGWYYLFDARDGRLVLDADYLEGDQIKHRINDAGLEYRPEVL